MANALKLAWKYWWQNFPFPSSRTYPNGKKEAISRFLKVFWLTITYRNTHTNLAILVISVIGLVSSLVRYELLQLLKPNDRMHVVYYIIWICVLSSSLSCCYLYIKIFLSLVRTRNRYVQAWIKTTKKHNWVFPVLALILSIIISVSALIKLYFDMHSWQEKLIEYKLPALLFYNVLFASRMLQRCMACVLITALAPVTHYWLELSSHETKESIVQLLPWHLFHMFQRLLTLLTLNELSWNYFMLLLFLSIQLFKLWIPAAALTIAHTYIFPILHAPRGDSSRTTSKSKSHRADSSNDTNRIMVTGITSPPPDYPPHAELVRGGTQERFKKFLQPMQPDSTTDKRTDQNRGGRAATRPTNKDYSFTASELLEDLPPASKPAAEPPPRREVKRESGKEKAKIGSSLEKIKEEKEPTDSVRKETKDEAKVDTLEDEKETVPIDTATIQKVDDDTTAAAVEVSQLRQRHT